MKQSYRYINQIFYNDNKFDIPESIESLEKYCLSNDKIKSLKNNEGNILTENLENKNVQQKISENNERKNLVENLENKNVQQKNPENIERKNLTENLENKNSENKNPEKVKWFYPKQPDSVFWCVFSFVHGFDEYNEIGHSYGNRILEEKMKIADFIKKTPKVLKESNIKITNMGIQEVISEFMVDNTTSFHGIAALAIYYKIQIYLIHCEKNIYLKFLDNNQDDCDDKKCYIYYDTYTRGQIKYKIPISKMDSPNLDSMVCLESHLKPFRPASNYKIDDLGNISQKIGFVYETRMKKLELYDKLSELCAWI